MDDNRDDGGQGAGKDANGRVGSPLRVHYRKEVDDLRDVIATVDLENRENFHHALWLVMEKGLSQKDFAEHRGFRASTVNRWVTGAKAPPPKRRPAVVRDALAMLYDEIRRGAPVVMKSFPEGDDADASPERKRAPKTSKG
jgi:hypothetical protein